MAPDSRGSALIALDSKTAVRLYEYKAFGLHISSALPLTEFPSARTASADLKIAFGEFARRDLSHKAGQETSYLEIGESTAIFWFKDVATFLIEGGERVTIALADEKVDRELLRLYVEGMVMAMVLYQRGACVLHASVVEINGYAIAFLGHVGAGKSSLAAALYLRGHRVLSDDNAAVRVVAGTPAVVPGYPFVKLFPKIAAMLCFDSNQLHPLHRKQEKLAGGVANGFLDSPLPLQAICILGRDHSPEITKISTLEATIHLVRNSVPTRWGEAAGSRHLKQCADLAMRTPVFAVRTFAELSELPNLATQVERHAAGALEGSSFALGYSS